MQLSRREFVAGGLALPGLAGAKTPPVRPNVVLILVDYLPSWILACYGGKDVRTPSINRLSQTGVRLQNHFTASPAPGPARASLLTGRTALQLKGADMIAEGDPSLARTLAGAGYACGNSAGEPAAVAGAAVKFLDAQAAGKPFFFEAWYRSLIPPYAGVDRKYADMYAQARFESAFPSEPPSPSARQGREGLIDLLGALRTVAAAITAVDDQIGVILAKLNEREFTDTSVVVFTSTCGALYGRHGLWGSSGGSDPINMYQEAVSTPMIWSWPVRMPPQTSRPEGIGACDFLPTVCEFAQIPPGKSCGRSYAPLLQVAPLPKKAEWRNVQFSKLGNTEMVRDTRYKLVLRDEGKGPGDLFDLQADPRERTNGYDDPQYTTVRDSLAGEIVKWRQSCAA